HNRSANYLSIYCKEIKMDANDINRNPSEITKALQVISPTSRALPTSPGPYENSRYSPYGAANRAEEGVRLRDVWTAISKRRWLIVSIVLLVTATTAVMLARKPTFILPKPRFKSTQKIRRWVLPRARAARSSSITGRILL